MNGTAINKKRLEDSMYSRFSESSLFTTAEPTSVAKTWTLDAMYIKPLESIPTYRNSEFIRVTHETRIELSPESFQHFLQTIENPPAPNANLERILQSDFE